jgi:hypothetical protein
MLLWLSMPTPEVGVPSAPATPVRDHDAGDGG